MPEQDPNELVWMHHEADGWSAFPAYAVEHRESIGWKKKSKAEAKKAGFVLPADAEPATKTAQEG